VEILQKCVPFTDKEFDSLKDPEKKEDALLRVEHGKPLVFGRRKNKGVVFRDFRTSVVEFEPGRVPGDVAVYDETNADMAYLVSGLSAPEFPMPIGVLHALEKSSYEELYYGQVSVVGDTRENELETLLSGPDAWEIK